MLIYTSKSPGWGKQKPKQWGPLSAVRSAVRHNCDNLGLPCPTGYWPMWEDGGSEVHDIINGNYGTTAAPWQSGGLCVNNAAGNEIQLSDNLALGTDDFTVKIYYSYNGYIQYSTLFAHGTYNFGFLFYQYGATNMMLRGGGFGIISTNKIPDLGDNISILQRYNGTGFRWFNNGELIYDNASAFSDTSDVDAYGNDWPYTLGARYDGSGASKQWNGSLYSAGVWKGYGNEYAAELLHETPYALLQPVPQTYVFDMGASLVPSLISPSNGLTGVNQPINFEWSSVSGASGYQLQIDETAGDFSTPVVDDATLTGTTKEVSGLTEGTEYKWRVRADV